MRRKVVENWWMDGIRTLGNSALVKLKLEAKWGQRVVIVEEEEEKEEEEAVKEALEEKEPRSTDRDNYFSRNEEVETSSDQTAVRVSFNYYLDQ